MNKFLPQLFLLASLVLGASTTAHAVDRGVGSGVGFWNTYLEQLNVIECHNLSLRTRSAELVIHSATQEVLAQQTLQFQGRSSQHLVVNPLAGPNRYGTFSFTTSDSDGLPNTLQCHTAVYRLARSSSLGKAVEYAYILPTASPIAGPSNGLFNSMDPAGGSNTVYNWLTLFNSGSQSISGRVELFDLRGQPVTDSTIHFADLNVGQRIDYALGHPRGQTIGMYRIVPDNSSGSYTAFTVRYAPRAGGFAFAIPLSAMPETLVGSTNGCHPQPVYASTMDPALNWAEVTNASDQAANAILKIFDQGGQSKGTVTLNLPPHAQQHVRINDFLGPRNIGLLRLECPPDNRGQIALQSMYYGFSRQNRLEWAYAAQQSGIEATTESIVAHSLNTYLGAANWALYINHSATSSGHDLRLLTSTGGIAAERSFYLSPSGTSAQDLHSAVGQNFIGIGFGRSLSTDAHYGTELLRAFPTNAGELGYIMRVPSYILPTSPAVAYFRVQSDDQSFVIRLTDSAKIAHARAILADPNRTDRHIMGRVQPTASEPDHYNQPWSFTLASDSVEFFELSAEICDYPLALLESEMRANGQTRLNNQFWCPWSSKLVEELIY